jgi:hypothetical protein
MHLDIDALIQIRLQFALVPLEQKKIAVTSVDYTVLGDILGNTGEQNPENLFSL